MYVISRNFSKDLILAIFLSFFSLLDLYIANNISHLVIMSFKINIFLKSFKLCFAKIRYLIFRLNC